jgi:hypothetical protein
MLFNNEKGEKYNIVLIYTTVNGKIVKSEPSIFASGSAKKIAKKINMIASNNPKKRECKNFEFAFLFSPLFINIA